MSVDEYFLTQHKYLHNRLTHKLFLFWAWIMFVREGRYANQNMAAYINTAFVAKQSIIPESIPWRVISSHRLNCMKVWEERMAYFTTTKQNNIPD